ncbi:UDP-glycosyltransferase 89B2-like [Gastrolobium bilobum]|uniref:UDP-glycosyltransferase 89B2-like n=1 Tax=Gastrolobium bilobum TaxID=150636 RepID=UPI002AB1AAF1|nr:UDP-glycosyltransferase 89B2-like [Gastrolobium bilobum]
MSPEICVVPFFGQGHLFPCMELCNHLASRNFTVTLLISSTIASSVPFSLRQNPLIRIIEISSSPAPPPHAPHNELVQGLENIFSRGPDNPNPARPVCAIIDVMTSWWTAHVFKKFEVPTVAFFTSGACSAALELATWKAHPLDLKPGEIRLLPGLPEDVALTYSDLKRRRHDPPPPPLGGEPPHHGGGAGFPPAPGGPGMGPPKFGEQPPWVEEVRETVALVINTCDDLERPFIDYIADHIGKPVWGVGPLLPEQYWKSGGSLLHDRDVRSNRRSSVTEEEVIQWLDSKPRGSVLYVSFGTEVGPTMEEYQQLAHALESCEQPFIWVLQPGSGRPGPPRMILGGEAGSGGPEGEEGYFPHGLDSRVGKRGLIIRGWAPQLLILSHPSTGGFLSHCGWNSTVEAIGRGVPFLVWPIRGDQYHDAKLVVTHLKVGYMICDDLSERVTKDDIVKGIQRLMGDKEMKKTAEILSAKFQQGFPRSSVDAFKDYINQRFA